MFQLKSTVEIITCSLIFIILISVHLVKSEDDLNYVKSKRSPYSGVSGLIPFPRTGRSDSDFENWELPPSSSFEEYEDYIPKIVEVKRQNLIAFPRVGRAGNGQQLNGRLQEYTKRSGPGSIGGMWFGPRLGKRNNDNRRDNVQDPIYSPRLGRESGEQSRDDSYI